jgi:hypothetical protein
MKPFFYLLLVVSFALPLSFAQEGTHDTATPSHHEAIKPLDNLLTPNILILGEHMLKLEPLLAPDGSMKLALSSVSLESLAVEQAMAEHHQEDEHSDSEHSETEHSETEHSETEHSNEEHTEGEHTDTMTATMSDDTMMLPIEVVITAPDGSSYPATTETGSVVVETGKFMEGVYSVSGSLANESFTSKMSVYSALSDLDNQVIVLFAPSPSLSTKGLTQAFVYAFSEGEAIHRGMSIKRTMTGMTHMSDDEEVSLGHEHFNDKYNMENFEPMANVAPISFAMAGTWEFTVNLLGSLPESAVFSILVSDD